MQTYGTLGEPGDKCETFSFGDEEIMYIKIYSDLNDIEGLEFTGNRGTVWTMRANGEEFEQF